jgi:hypothetical protein
MSQSIYVVDWNALSAPEPRTLQEIWTQIEARLQQRAPSSPKFAELASRLEGLPWPCALSQDTGHGPVWNIAAPPADDLVALNQLVMQAADLGLVIFLDYVGVALLPGSRVLPAEQQDRWELLFEELPTTSLEPASSISRPELRKRLRAMLGQRLEPLGFRFLDDYPACGDGTKDRDRQTFVRELPDGWQGVYVYIIRMRGVGDVLSCGAYGSHESVQQVVRDCGLGDVNAGLIDGDYGFYFGKLVPVSDFFPVDGTKIVIEKPNGIDFELAGRVFDMVASVIPPLLDRMKTVGGIDLVLNGSGDAIPGEGWSKHGNMRYALAAAYLTRNPRLDLLIDHALKEFSGDTEYAKAMRDGVRRLREMSRARSQVG